MLVDTHCHIHDQDTYNFAFSRQQISKKFLHKYPDFPHTPADFTPEKIIARAHENDVKQMICVSTSYPDAKSAAEFAKKYQPEGIFWALGIHPDEAEQLTDHLEDTIVKLKSLAIDPNLPNPVAIGEIGLDYRAGPPRPGVSERGAQIRLLEQQLQLASDLKLPVIFHVRDAFSDFFAVIKNFPSVSGVVHSFSDSKENLDRSLSQGFFIGINGLVTFAPEIPLPPLDRALLETDAPFLTPAPFRGKINESAQVKTVCQYLSGVLDLSETEVERITTENARKLFRLPRI